MTKTEITIILRRQNPEIMIMIRRCDILLSLRYMGVLRNMDINTLCKQVVRKLSNSFKVGH